MKRDGNRRLRLHRETVRVLGADALAGVAGGSDYTDPRVYFPKSNGWSRYDGVGNATCVRL